MSDRSPPTLAEKLDRLWRTMHERGAPEWGYPEVSARIVDTGGPTVSAQYLWQLRTGRKTNPSMRVLEALARVFGVSPAYFFDEEAYERIDEQLELIAKLRDSSVMRVATRAADLSPEALRAIAGMVEHARRLEGLPDGEQDEPSDPPV